MVYSSGRFKNSITSVIKEEKLIQPDTIISNVGTEIYYAPNWDMDEEWEKIISKNWNEEEIASILDSFDIKLQPYNKRFVISYYVNDEDIVRKIKERLKEYEARVIYTKKRCLDVIPVNAGKGNAAEYLGNKMNLPIICCGDSGNDEDMLKKSKYGVLVGNAPSGLKRRLSKHSNIYIAKACYAKGVIEGLRIHSVIC